MLYSMEKSLHLMTTPNRHTTTMPALTRDVKKSRKAPTFIDVFAGCGGLSLGLKKAGWKGLFAVEKDAFAFDTLTTNFKGRGKLSYSWPKSIEKRPWTVRDILDARGTELAALRGKVDLLAGGPPCQGFSHAGRRRVGDPRNRLFEDYLELIATIQPTIVLVENVRGFTSPFSNAAGSEIRVFSDALQAALQTEYDVTSTIVRASDFGVPQGRSRFFCVGILKSAKQAESVETLFDQLHRRSGPFLSERGLRRSPSSRDAISDLELRRNGRVECTDSAGFEAIGYIAPRTALQRYLREGSSSAPSDTRLAKHRPEIEQRFATIISACREDGRLNIALSSAMREQLGLKKMATRVLDPLQPSPTITSMPDDLLHYSEPRTLTVRENARLQTFPDWFEFRGKYTSGGVLRRNEVPRFTQVANAVPPLLAEQLGFVLRDLIKRC
jgi:DNA (cytosine-5)-methyltransferase 1